MAPIFLQEHVDVADACPRGRHPKQPGARQFLLGPIEAHAKVALRASRAQLRVHPFKLHGSILRSFSVPRL
jgi:hypothetical protein